MAINYAKKYSSKVDERFKLGSLTNGLVNNDYDWVGVETVAVYSIPTVALGDYSLTGSTRYGTASELQNSVQEMQLTRDRAFTFTIDKKSHDDTMMAMEAGKALRREIDEVVIPEIDTYRLTKIAAGADYTGGNAITTSNAYSEFLDLQEILDNKKVPAGGRICIASPAYIKNLKLDSNFVKASDMAVKVAFNGVVGEVDGVPIIKVPTSYLPEDVDFIITRKEACPAPSKLTEYKVHDDVPGISGWLVEGRVRYDAFILNEKKAGIAVHKYTAPTPGT